MCSGTQGIIGQLQGVEGHSKKKGRFLVVVWLTWEAVHEDRGYARTLARCGGLEQLQLWIPEKKGTSGTEDVKHVDGRMLR